MEYPYAGNSPSIPVHFTILFHDSSIRKSFRLVAFWEGQAATAIKYQLADYRERAMLT
jgi:hypothetical protein